MTFIDRDRSNFHPSKAQAFTHKLQNHPLMQFEELKKLALRHNMVRFHSSNLPRTQKLDTVEHERPNGLSLQESLDNINTSGTFVFIQNIQNDPIYGPFVNEILDEIETDISKHQRKLQNRQAWVFITSPGGVTPYHRDQEAATYFHIKGKKKFWLWDANDREICTQEENEFFHGVHGLKKTDYNDQKMAKAKMFEILPGDGIFFPYTAPHMVENGTEEFAISFSVTHMTEDDFNVRRINKINQILRKLGLSPRDLSESRLIDNMKLAMHFMIRNLTKMTKYRFE
jgi:hypothetical protein